MKLLIGLRGKGPSGPLLNQWLRATCCMPRVVQRGRRGPVGATWESPRSAAAGSARVLARFVLMLVAGV